MWQCCASNNETVVNSIKKEECEDIHVTTTAATKNDDFGDKSSTAKGLDTPKFQRHRFSKDFKELIKGYKINWPRKFIDMSQPRDASYSAETDYNFDTDQEETVETERLGKDVCLTSAARHQNGIKHKSFDPYGYRSMPTEVRGITLRQLRAILPLIKRRCEEEKWTRSIYRKGKKTKKKEKVTLENATMYDINNYIIKPFTEFSQQSFVETLPSTKGTQPPRWFVSHYWGQTFVHTMACLECLVQDFRANEKYRKEDDKRGGGMTEDTPVWICAFANNQHNLESDIADDPADTSFAKAMKIAKFRVISILDAKNQVYTRLWCMYELYLTLLLSREQGIDGVLGIYTYHEHENDHDEMKTAVGLVEGGTTSEKTDIDERQSHFPRERLLPFFTVSIQNAVASRDEDRTHILNSLVGRKGFDLDLEPLKHHDNYDKLNDAIRGAVFSSQISLNHIYETGEKIYWNSALSALEKSILKEFTFNSYRMPQLTNEAVAQVFHHLPSGLEKLEIWSCPHGRVAVDALLDWLENKSTNLESLDLGDTFIGGEIGGKECGERLARFLTRNDCKIGKIVLMSTDLVGSRNVDTWIECLKKNESLKEVRVSGMANYVKYVGEFEKPNTTIDDVLFPIYWDGTTFPDATLLSIEQEKALNETVFKFEDYHPKYSIKNFLLKDSDGEESTS